MKNKISYSDLNELTEIVRPVEKYVKKKVVFIICPDPFNHENSMYGNTLLKDGFKHAADSGRKMESPIICYAYKLGLFGFNQWQNRLTSFSDQDLFNMSVSQMLKCDYIAVYGDKYTSDMEKLINVAKHHFTRIDFRK